MNLESNKKLVDLINSSFSNAEERDFYNAYVDNIDNNSCPAILSFAHLSDLLEITPTILAKISYGAKKFYRNFQIPKRSGGLREISAPLPSLAEIQNWISQNIIKKLPIDKESTTAYEKNSSIKNHVVRHADQPYLLKLDIKGFFPSITIIKVIDMFLEVGYSIQVSYTLANLVTLEGSLPQGAPSSPFISNAIVKEMDNDLREYCDNFNLKYSRYADDLAFSGNNITVDIIEDVKKIINSHQFILNHGKERLYIPGMQGRFLTGLVINGSEVRVPKATRKRIKQSVYYIKKYIYSDLGIGLIPTREKNYFIDPLCIERTIGQLNFWKWIEPECEYVNEALLDIYQIRAKIYSLNIEK